jgi:hypothetical protein
MFKRAVFVLMLCTSAHAAEEPQWLKEARARETKSLKPAEIKSKDSWFKARVPGKLASTIEKVDGSYSVELVIGGAASVHCEVYPEGTDIANALRTTLNGAVEHINTAQGKIEVRALEGTESGVHGAVPYIKLTWLYRVSTPEGAKVGSFKQFIMEKGLQAVYCAHNDLGFTRTFTAITQAFAETLEVQEESPAPQYKEISTASMSGSQIGYAITTLEKDADGDFLARQVTAMLIATNDGAVQAQDSTHINWVRADGSLINAANSEVANGELSNSLSLKTADGAWVVEGEVQGKPVKTSLPKDAQPGSWVGQAQQLRALLASPNPVGQEHTMGIWLAENPEKLTVARTKILARQGDNHFTARGDIGGMTANLVLEKSSGMASTADIKIGPINLKLERVYASGTL